MRPRRRTVAHARIPRDLPSVSKLQVIKRGERDEGHVMWEDAGMTRTEILVQRARPGTALVSLIGEHDAYNAPKLSSELAALLAEELDVVVDLRRATFVDSRTVGVLLEALAAARERRRRLVLWIDDETGPAVRKLVEVTRLGVIIPVVRSLEEAAGASDR